MKPSVRAAFVGFTKPLEGVIAWMYQDVRGLITTAIGNLIDPLQMAMPLPWVHFDGSPASRDEIAAEWLRVKANPVAAQRGHLYTEGITNLRLTPEGIDLVVSRKLSQFDAQLTERFPDWEQWPADAQLATLSMAWACGAAFRFPQLEAALRAFDFATAAATCHIDEHGNAGIAPRNRANISLYRNAAKVASYHLDPDALVWPSVLDDEAITQPELPNPPSERPPTAADQPTIHPDPRSYLDPTCLDDPDPETA